MIATIRVGLFAAVCALPSAAALAGEPATDDRLRTRIAELEAKGGDDDRRIAELEARLAALESKNAPGVMDQERTREIRALVESVLADAESRASLKAQGLTAGYEDGAVISSADGDWLLKTNILLQTRFMLRAQSGLGIGADDTLWGFETTRAKFILQGHVFNPQWFYRVSIETSPNTDASVSYDSDGDGSITFLDAFKSDDRFGLNEAYAGYDFENGVKLKAGTMKAPLLFEELVDARYQQAVERSLVNYLYTGAYVDGVAVEYATENLRLAGMLSNGISDGLFGGGVAGGTAQTGGMPALVSDTDFAGTFRAEWLAAGTWEQMQGYTSRRDDEGGVLIGGAVHWQMAEDDTPLVPDISWLVLTLDASFEFGGGNVYAAVIYGNADLPAPADDATPLGLILGGGWYFADDWELFGRYEWSDADIPNTDDVSIATVGVNGYFAGQNVKWSTDIGLGLNTVSFAVPVTGWNADAAGEDGQVVIRSQLQIVF
jgi:hypothetical protein